MTTKQRDDLKRHAGEMGRMLQTCIEVLGSVNPESDPELFYPVRSLGLDSELCFLIKDLSTGKDTWVATNLGPDNAVWAAICDEEQVQEINSGKWDW